MRKVAGVAVLCADPDGKVIGTRYSEAERFSSLADRKYIHKLKGEHWGVVLTSVARQYPFPEVKGFVPEGLVWMEMACDYDDICVNEPLRVYYRDEPDALSKVRRSYGWLLYHRAVVRRDWRYVLHAPLRIGYSLMVCLVWFWKR